MNIQPGVGYNFASSSEGVTLDIGDPFPQLTVINYRPLFPNIVSDKVYVSPGTVNRFIPTIAGTYLDASTPPFITVSAEGYICIRIGYVASTFFPRTAEIVFYAGSVSPADTATYGYYPLAKVNTATVGGVTTYSLIALSYGNFVCNRLKAGAGTAVYYWGTITPQPGA
jgi:hypothetical protein